MSVTTITQTLSSFPTAPARSQDQTTFRINAENHVVALGTHVTECNTQVSQINTLAGELNTIGTNTQNASDAALAAANFRGAWSSLTGALNVPSSVNHNGNNWLLLNNLADVTTSEPGVSADWSPLKSETDWETLQSVSFTLESGKAYPLEATSATLNATLPAGIAQGNTFIVSNSSDSTQQVFITNASYTIKGRKDELLAGDDLELEPGDSVQLVAFTNTTLRIV